MKYRYSDGEKDYGELEISEIHRRMKTSRDAKHLIWKEGMQEWQPAETVLQMSKNRKRTVVLIGIAVLLVAVLCVVVGGLMKPKDLAQVGCDWKGGVAALNRDIHDNLITAKKKYNGTVFQLSGAVSYLDEDGFWVSELLDSKYGVRCRFDYYRKSLEAIKNGDVITVKGVLDLDGSDPTMTDCVIVNENKE